MITTRRFDINWASLLSCILIRDLLYHTPFVLQGMKTNRGRFPTAATLQRIIAQRQVCELRLKSRFDSKITLMERLVTIQSNHLGASRILRFGRSPIKEFPDEVLLCRVKTYQSASIHSTETNSGNVRLLRTNLSTPVLSISMEGRTTKNDSQTTTLCRASSK